MRQDDTLKLFSLPYHKIYESLIKNIKISKESIKQENLSLLVVTCQHIQNMCIDLTHNP